MVWVKICANTNLHDAQMAVELGADAIGFVFAPSKRRVTPELVGEITSRIHGREVECIGVFYDHEFDLIRSAVAVGKLNGVQLHGGIHPELNEALRREFDQTISITQTLSWTIGDGGSRTTAVELIRLVKSLKNQGTVDRILVDSKVGNLIGGTGKSFDWDEGKALFSGAGSMKMIVAGGLNPDNVETAIRLLKPWGVDVASGVESSPGRKDPERLRLFIANARAAAGPPAP